MKFNLENVLNGEHSLSPEGGTFPGVFGLWHKAPCVSFAIRQGLSIKSHQRARVPPLNTNQDGAPNGVATTPWMYPARIQRGRWHPLPHCHPTEHRTMIFMNKARPGGGTAATGFPSSSDTVIQGVTRAGRSDRRSRVWPQTSRKMTPGNGRTAWLAGLPIHTHCPRWWGTFTKEVSNICNYQPLYLVTMNIKTLMEKIFK